MLIKVTNYCSMGCSHCMEDSTVKGEHMPEATFAQALAKTCEIEILAHNMGLKMAMLSGGECTEHPDIVRFVEMAIEQRFQVVLITNGAWIGNAELRAALLRPEWKREHLMVQVTNDSRFYPTAVPKVDDARVLYVHSLTGLVPLGRAARSKKVFDQGVPSKRAPTSFNIRSLTRSYGNIQQAVLRLRMYAVTNSTGWCSPSISANGDIAAGETSQCFTIGNVWSSTGELTEALLSMRCNRCGLVDNLNQEEKRAIGESVLYAGNEP